MNRAEKEIELAIKRENPNWDGESFDYGIACYKSALKAFNSLCEDEHSGMSIQITKNILNRLIDDKPLTPITEEDFEGVEGFYDSNCVSYRCPRMGLFKEVYDDGRISYYDVNRTVFIDELGHSWNNGLASKVINSLYPITLPYMPSDEPYKVYGFSFMVDKNNKVYIEKGSYNFKYLSHYIEPNGTRHEIDRLFIEQDGVDDMKECFGERKKIILENSKPIIEQSIKEHKKWLNDLYN